MIMEINYGKFWIKITARKEWRGQAQSFYSENYLSN